MSDHPQSRPSFSPRSRWSIGFDVVLRTVLVLAVLVMVNFLGTKFFHRFYLSSQTRIKLSSSTVNVLHSLTNHMDVTLYYDRSDDFYPAIVALLNEYQLANPNIAVHTVDYLRDAGQAEKIKAEFNLSTSNLVIFSLSDQQYKVVPGGLLTSYKEDLEKNPDTNSKDLYFERKPVAFLGEMMFTPAVLALESTHPLKAYFLQGHGEPSLTDSGNTGLLKFGAVFAQNYVTLSNLDLVSQPEVPLDCNLLIIAAPTKTLFPAELDKINRYLQEGGRMFAMFNMFSLNQPTGLDPILNNWGVAVANDYAVDAKHTMSGYDVVVNHFGQHPLVSALTGLSLQLYCPRPIAKVNWPDPPANAPQVDVLFSTSPDATLAGNRNDLPRSYPLACAVEQKPVVGGTNRRGTTRIVVVGDDVFLGNYYIDGGEGGANRDFLGSTINWLLDRTELVKGIAPRPVTEFRLQITTYQQQQIRWLLLGALPGGVLLFGWIIWLARRK